MKSPVVKSVSFGNILLPQYFYQITAVQHPNYSSTPPRLLQYYYQITLGEHTSGKIAINIYVFSTSFSNS